MCVPGKTEDLNIKLLNMITKINEVKTLVKKTFHSIVNANY